MSARELRHPRRPAPKTKTIDLAPSDSPAPFKASSRSVTPLSTWKLVLLVSFFLAIGEILLIIVAWSPTFLSDSDLRTTDVTITAFFIIGTMFLFIGTGEPQSSSLGRFAELVRRTPDHFLTRIYLHKIYGWLGLMNFAILFSAAFIASSRVNSDVYWTFFTLSCALTILWYKEAVMNIFGQKYKDLYGNSIPVAASLGGIASRMFARKKRVGLSVLQDSLTMCTILYNKGGFRPERLQDVLATVEGLDEVEKLPYEELKELADVLSELPKPNRVPSTFDNFLTQLNWPRKFEKVKTRRMSRYELLTIILTFMTAIGISLEAFSVWAPKAASESTFLGATSYLMQWGPALFVLFGIVGISFFQLITNTYSISIFDIRPFTNVKNQFVPSEGKKRELTAIGEFGSSEWQRVIDHPGYLATFPVLSQAFSLFGQACGSMDAGANAAASLLCRSTLETAFYLIVTTGDATSNGWVLDIPRDVNGKPRMVGSRELQAAIKGEEILSENEVFAWNRIRDHGNLIAHLADLSNRRIFSPGAEETMLWISPENAKKDLGDTADILRTLTDWVFVHAKATTNNDGPRFEAR